ncbi:MAG: hypothetical protein AB1757_16820 [Acidobacteriota bacterium]
MEAVAQFEVTGHYDLPRRGVLLIGHILGDGIKVGMQIPTHDEPPFLTISGIEALCNPSKQIYKQALIFREKPTLEFLERVFPVGTIIKTKQGEAGL